MRRYVPRVAIALGAIAVVVAAGAGAYAFGPSSRNSSVPMTDAQAPAPVEPSGASASPGPSSTSAPSTAPSTTPPSTTAPTSSAPSPTPSKSKAPATCAKGDKHAQTEVYLAQIGTFGPITVDGQQSESDCATIKKFQSRYGISPANGKAGPTTADVARRIAGSMTEAERAKCGAGSGLVACVDLTLQTMWVVRDGAVILGPTVVRTGKPGFATPSGTYKINGRSLKEWSDPYKVWLPYWQRIVGGDGFHETTTYIHNTSIGSHGCVNLLHADATKLWTTINNGTTVKLFGRRPGT